jgi:hypothetical protein
VAHAYTPGLRVSEKTHVVKIRRLPLKGQVVAKKGDTVKAETVVARTELPGNVQPVKAASILGVHQQDLLEFMLKKEGGMVEKEEIFATSKSFFGLFKSHVKSPCTGTIESISTVTGQVIIREPPIPVEVDAYIDGLVTSVIEGEGVVVETEGAFIQGIFGVGGETNGILQMLTDDPAREITADLLREEHKGKVVVGGSRLDMAAIARAREVGARAIVVGGIDDQILRDLLGYDLGVAITGHENLGVTVVVTEGFGKMGMAGRTFSLLGKFQGKKVSVNGATQIRAGVMRPEIVIPSTDTATAATGLNKDNLGMTIGSPIRVIRMPHFGALGEVVELPPELRQLETEAKVRVLRVRFADGTEDTLPRANVEMIEG